MMMDALIAVLVYIVINSVLIYSIKTLFTNSNDDLKSEDKKMEINDVLRMINKDLRLLADDKERINLQIAEERESDQPDDRYIDCLLNEITVINSRIDTLTNLFLKIKWEMDGYEE